MSGATREVVCTVRLTADEAGRLDAMAASTGRSRSDLMRTFVAQALGAPISDVAATGPRSGRTSPPAKPAPAVRDPFAGNEVAAATETLTASALCSHPTTMRRRLPKYGITLCDPDQGGCGARLR